LNSIAFRSASLVAALQGQGWAWAEVHLGADGTSRYTSVMKLLQLPILFAAIRVFHIFKDALPFGISIGARPAIDERGILDFENKNQSAFRTSARLPIWTKKTGSRSFRFLIYSESANDWSHARGVFVAETDG
jgi:hypothetical protein